ncbi:hypothetical protein Poli38472_009127 [Pythium oligandrum]|uniref:Uncharacterized protein n=1 Tax=Pythium oligandrum TaxID=41045 RepID=A0A8K1CKK0_PYTOL|nr:hypothetical protein Poli38472_009127 [Pythium oligandrum]|eukprot:TMW64960.1 hypothetical protein Poli38472_009127 [Pythium oligandrum]
MSTTPVMPLLPPDYHREVARELVEFFHTFYRFGSATNTFNLNDPQYQQFLHNLLFGSLTIGALVFIILCIIVVRRTILHIRSAYARRWAMESNSLEISAVILLTVLAISSLSGLLGEAQVDYSASVVRGAMTNMSHVFTDSQHLAWQSANASADVRFRADSMIVSFNESDLPQQASKLSLESLRMLHAARDLANVTDALLPKNYADVAKEWQFSYFMLKSTTNFAILSVALASFLSISSIGWSMLTPLRVSILIILSVVPISHTLIGVYLSSTIMTADFCAAPMNSTVTLLDSTPVVNYYIECQPNVTNPFKSYVGSLQDTTDVVSTLQKELEDYAKSHGDIGSRMKNDFLDPIGAQIQHIDEFLTTFNKTQSCQPVAASFEHAVDAYCEYGVLGFFSMWVHQIILCLILFISVVTSVLVYERVHIREIRTDIRYQMLSTYDDDNMEHVYLSSD